MEAAVFDINRLRAEKILQNILKTVLEKALPRAIRHFNIHIKSKLPSLATRLAGRDLFISGEGVNCDGRFDLWY